MERLPGGQGSARDPALPDASREFWHRNGLSSTLVSTHKFIGNHHHLYGNRPLDLFDFAADNRCLGGTYGEARGRFAACGGLFVPALRDWYRNSAARPHRDGRPATSGRSFVNGG